MANKTVKTAGNYKDPVYIAQKEGRQKANYNSGSAGGGVVHDYSNYKNTGDTGSTKRTSTSSQPATGSFDWAAYYQSLSNQANAAAEDAYNNNMARINEMYNNVAGNIGSNYDSMVGRLKAARNQSLKDVNADAERSLRQAYINSELTKKGLDQRLSAMGYNGGATESTMADLANQYSRSRGGINTTRNSNIADLNQTYADNLASALQAYNNAMNNLEMQKMQMENAAEQARLNNLQSGNIGSMSVDSGYLTALQAALQNQAGFQFDPSQATNAYNPGNVQQAQSASEATNYQKLLEQAKLEAANNGATSAQYNLLFPAIQRGEIDYNTAYAIMNALSSR